MPGQSCSDLGLLKPAALGGPVPGGQAVMVAGSGYSLHHHAGAWALGIGFILFVIFSFWFYYSSYQWTFQKTPTGEVTTQKNLALVLGIAFLLAAIIAILIFLFMKH